MPILMCPPRHYAVSYEINPWMHVDVPVDPGSAAAQWQALHRLYTDLGETVEVVEPVAGLPDMVFTANAGVVWRGRAVLARFRHEERRREEPYWLAAFEQLGLETVPLPSDLRFEGAGDALFVGERLFCGWGCRTDRQAHGPLGDLLGVEVVSLELVDPRFYHLDTCFWALDDDTVVVLPGALSPASMAIVRTLVPTVIEVPLDTALGFGCNGIAVGRRLISSPAIEQLREPLAAAGFEVIASPVSEFVKAGGGVRCLSLPVVAG